MNSFRDQIKNLAKDLEALVFGEKRHRGEISAGLIMIVPVMVMIAFSMLTTRIKVPGSPEIAGVLTGFALLTNVVGTILLSQGDLVEIEEGPKKVNWHLLVLFLAISLTILIFAHSPWILYWITLYLVMMQSQVAIFLENKSIRLLFFVMGCYLGVMVGFAFWTQSFVYIQILVAMLTSLSFEYVRRRSIASTTQIHNNQQIDGGRIANLFNHKATSQLIGSWAQILIYISFLVFVVSISGIDLVADEVVNNGEECEYILLNMVNDSCITKKIIEDGQDRLLDTASDVYSSMIDVKIFLISLLVGLVAIKSQTNSAQNYIATSRDTPMILLDIKSQTNPAENYIRTKWLRTVMTFLWLYLVMISVLLLGFLLNQQIDFELLHQPFDQEVIYKFGSVLTHMIFEFSVLSILPEWLYFYTLAAGASYLEDIS